MSTECKLCGATSPSVDVKVSLVQWLVPEPLAGRLFEDLPRCVDRVACRARVEAAGGRWALRDQTPGHAPLLAPETEAPTAEPVIETTPQDDRPADSLGELGIPEWL